MMGCISQKSCKKLIYMVDLNVVKVFLNYPNRKISLAMEIHDEAIYYKNRTSSIIHDSILINITPNHLYTI